MSRRVVLSLVLTGAIGVLSTLPGAGAASGPRQQPPAAVPGGPEAVFDPESAGWYSYRSHTSDEFHDTYLARRNEYLPVDIDVNTDDGYRVGSVWQENLDDRDWRVKRNLTSDEYRDYWEDARADGFRPVETETYVVNGNRRWAGIWVQNVEGYTWASHRGQNAVEFEMSRAQHAADGLMPVDLDEYVTGGGRRYASVWVTSTYDDWRLVRNLKKQEWADTFEANADDGFRVLNFGSVLVGGKQRYFGVFVTNDNGRGWYFRRELTKKKYNNWWYRYRDLGYRVVGLDRYQTTDGPRYAAIWRQNAERPSWAFRTEVDTLVTDELDQSDVTVPGIAVAVYHSGVPVYLRGFGDADVEDGIWMDSAHIGSIASVAKAVAGVLTMRLVEQRLIDLDDLTEDLVPTMPDHHTHTVGQLLSNRGCVRHYNNGTSVIDETSYPTALAAADEFWDDALLCDPATEDEYHYSTHGYTLLGAALEAVAGDDVKDLVRNELTTPFGLGTLGPQSTAGRRMSYYMNGDEIDQPNNDWKVLGGGLDSNVADLARFGWLLADGQILRRDSFTTMWNRPTPVEDYAYGWTTSPIGGLQVVSKSGGQDGTRSYLRIYPTRGLSIAVIMNDRAGNAIDLGTAIGDLIVNGSPS